MDSWKSYSCYKGQWRTGTTIKTYTISYSSQTFMLEKFMLEKRQKNRLLSASKSFYTNGKNFTGKISFVS